MSSTSTNPIKCKKPDLIYKFEKFEFDINFAYIVPNEDAVIVLVEDRSIRIYIKREMGGYWPAVFHLLPSSGICLQYCEKSKHIYIGCDNGTIMEYVMKDDFNAIVHVKDYLAHVSRITGLVFSYKLKWILSCSKDKLFAIYSSETGSCIDGFQLQSPCSSIKFDEDAKCVFVGDMNGRIAVLDIRKCSEVCHQRNTSCIELRKNLNGHSDQAIRSLDWDAKNKKLISSGDDNLVIIWDIGGNKGEALELLGHYKPVMNVISLESVYNKKKVQLNNMIISSSLDESIIFWIMSVERHQTPSWSSCNNCEICNTPFFWNWKKMWEDRKVGGRQHHCRKCGKAVCDNCSNNFSRFPPMGFEIPVRMCGNCRSNIDNSDLVSLINAFDSKHPVISMNFDYERQLLVTVGKDRILKLWNVAALLA